MDKKCLALLPLLFLFLPACSNDHDSTEEGSRSESQHNSPEEHIDNPMSDESQDSTTEENFIVETVADNLDVPWSVQPFQDSFFITEREGTIAYIDENKTVHRQEVHLREEVADKGEGGLLGFVLDPDFSKNRKAFVYHTYTKGNNIYNRIVSIEQSDNQWQEKDILLEEIPGSSIHNGGRLKLGPDNKLYATTGDANQPDLAQQPENLAGSILRINMNGNIPADNPIEDSYVYSYGHRNPQGLDWSDDGALYSSEHGPSGQDEINHILPGENYGWPTIRGDERQEDMQSPVFHSGEDTWAPSGSVFHTDDDFYVTGLRGTQLMRFHVEEYTMDIVFSGEGRLRDVSIDDEETMYVLTNNRDGRGNPSERDDRLLRISHFQNHVMN